MTAHAPSRYHALLLAGTMLAALPSLGGCILFAAGAGAGAGYATFAQERSTSDQLKDTTIGALVSQSWNQFNPALADDLTATVYEGRVLVTGRVPNDQWRAEAIQRTWKVENVKEVQNEIEVGPDTHFADTLHDKTISTRLTSDLVFDSQVKSINYTIRTANGIVYIVGSARSQAELERVTGYARNIPNVRKVVTYVRIRSGEPSQPVASGGPPPASAAAAPPAQPVPVAGSEDTPAGAPTPRGSIEVTPLK